MKKVLLVEDQNPYLYEHLLRAYNGFDYIVCKRGDHALTAYLEHKPALVLMDIRLPMLDGIKAIKQIRQHDLAVPIIVITAYDTKDTRQRAYAAGCNDFFAKPFSYQRLYQRIVELSVRQFGQLNDDELDHVRQLLKNKIRRQRALEERRALTGISTSPEILLEIEDLKNEIAELQQRLA